MRASAVNILFFPDADFADLGTTATYLQFAVNDRKKAYDKVFGAKPDNQKVQCPGCGFNFRLKKNREIDLEDRLKAIF